MTGARFLPWDSEFWGFPVARITPATGGENVAEGIEWCRQHDIRVAYLLAPSGDPPCLRLAQELGFRVIDTRVELIRDSGEVPTVAVPAGIELGSPEDGELEALQSLARGCFRMTRFFTDPRFDPRRAAELYAVWVSRRYEDPVGEVVVARRHGRPVGFMLGSREQANRGRHDLYAVEPTERGLGVGTTVVAELSRRLVSDGVEVETTATQAANLASLRVFELNGFRVRTIDHWLHLWFD